MPRRSGRPGRGSSTQSRCPQPRYRRHPPAPTRPRAAAARPSPRARLGARNAAGRKSSGATSPSCDARGLTPLKSRRKCRDLQRRREGRGHDRASEACRRVAGWWRPGVVCDGGASDRSFAKFCFQLFLAVTNKSCADRVWANGHEAARVGNREPTLARRGSRAGAASSRHSRRARLPARCKTAGARAVWRVRRGHSAARTHRWRWRERARARGGRRRQAAGDRAELRGAPRGHLGLDGRGWDHGVARGKVRRERARAFRGVPFPGRGGVRRGRAGLLGRARRARSRGVRTTHSTTPTFGDETAPGRGRTRRIPRGTRAERAPGQTTRRAEENTRGSPSTVPPRTSTPSTFYATGVWATTTGISDRSPPGMRPRRSATWKSCARAWRVTSRRISTGQARSFHVWART